ncbi:hypothetical protein EV127DRAFT_410781 [Xylaria flabelliformis]|nr:hypothetical protein EV127DRAFT_410781 [Xylaria flabelliformis]
MTLLVLFSANHTFGGFHREWLWGMGTRRIAGDRDPGHLTRLLSQRGSKGLEGQSLHACRRKGKSALLFSCDRPKQDPSVVGGGCALLPYAYAVHNGRMELSRRCHYADLATAHCHKMYDS